MKNNLENALDFSNKTVLVTGGASGIGLGIARVFEQAGADVTVTGIPPQEEQADAYSGLRYLELDVTKPEQVASLPEKIDSLDVLVNSIGTVLWGGGEFEQEGFDFVMQVNLNGVMNICNRLKSKLADRKGSIINIDSIVSNRVAGDTPAYSASKAGLKHLTKALALKWGALGIRVNGIAPGAVPTQLTSEMFTPEAEADFGKRVPVGRYATPEDMGAVVLFLASPLAAYITGVSVPVDGGLSLLFDPL